MFKEIPRRPIDTSERYLRYGFVITEAQQYICPRCHGPLNAGPNYQPRYCDNCGQRLNFEGAAFRPARQIGYTRKDDRVIWDFSLKSMV